MEKKLSQIDEEIFGGNEDVERFNKDILFGKKEEDWPENIYDYAKYSVLLPEGFNKKNDVDRTNTIAKLYSQLTEEVRKYSKYTGAYSKYNMHTRRMRGNKRANYYFSYEFKAICGDTVYTVDTGYKGCVSGVNEEKDGIRFSYSANRDKETGEVISYNLVAVYNLAEGLSTPISRVPQFKDFSKNSPVWREVRRREEEVENKIRAKKEAESGVTDKSSNSNNSSFTPPSNKNSTKDYFFDPDDYDDPDSYAEDAEGHMFDTYDEAYDYWEDW